jgi:hypothetical protein
MHSPTGEPTTTLLGSWQPPVEATPFPTACFRVFASLLCLNKQTQAISSRTFGAFLATSEPYSVVLPIRRSEGVAIACDEEPACRDTHVWWGVPCRFVRVYLGLPVIEQSTPRPFVLRALLPLRDVEDVAPGIRLGAEFLYANHARVELESAPARGRLLIQ